jgi:hypothetical protein
MSQSAPRTIQPDTRKLLTTGGVIFAIGAVSLALMYLAFGGVSRQGPHTNGGWLALIIAMGCVPTGVLTLLLGFSKLVGEKSRR